MAQADPCPSCGHTHPWHSIVCPKARGANCLECEAILPRHYPWCSHGQRDSFFCWGVPRDMQHELEEYYNKHMKARMAQRISPETERSAAPVEPPCPECGASGGRHEVSCPVLQRLTSGEDTAAAGSQLARAEPELLPF